MKNAKAYLTYALNKDGDLVHIDSVPNGNKCAFAQDPEENWIELIQRAEKTDWQLRKSY